MSSPVVCCCFIQRCPSADRRYPASFPVRAVMVEHEDVVEAVATFIAHFVASHPEVRFECPILPSWHACVHNQPHSGSALDIQATYRGSLELQQLSGRGATVVCSES